MPANPNQLLYSSVAVGLISAAPISRVVLTGNNYGIHNDAFSVVSANGISYIYRGGIGSSTDSAATEVFAIDNEAISLVSILLSNGSNKMLVGDFLIMAPKHLSFPLLPITIPQQ
jgi:hypothetical protein